MPTKLLNFDSKDSTYNQHQTFNTYLFSTTNPNLAYNSYNCTWNLQTPLYGAYKLKLKTVEIPLVFRNVRSSNNSNILTISTAEVSGTNYTVVLPDKSYNSITTLLTDLQAAYLTSYPSLNVSFSLSSTGQVIVSSTNAAFNSGIFILDSIMANIILGFNYPLNTYNTLSTTAAFFPNLAYDTYVNLLIQNLPNKNPNNNGKPCSFKIPLNCPSGQGVIYFMGDNASSSQYLDFNVQTISTLSVSLYDRFGYSINSCGADWSFSVEIDYL